MSDKVIRRWTVTLFALSTAATLAACGGAATASGPVTSAAAVTTPATAQTTAAPVTTTAPATPAAKAPTDLASLATKIGCTGYAQSATPAPNADQWGSCTLAGKAVKLYLIPTDAGYQAFLDSVKAYGVTAAWMVRVAPFVVAPDDQTQIPTIKAALGAS